jgi:S-formylglutathione hydrolase FrmB
MYRWIVDGRINGALRLALGYPDLFHERQQSQRRSHGRRAQAREGPQAQEFVRIFGRNPTGSEHDLRVLAKRCASRRSCRSFASTAAWMISSSTPIARFHHFLTQQRIPHEYEEYPGEHNWDYWTLHVQEALQFHAKALKL